MSAVIASVDQSTCFGSSSPKSPTRIVQSALRPVCAESKQTTSPVRFHLGCRSQCQFVSNRGDANARGDLSLARLYRRSVCVSYRTRWQIRNRSGYVSVKIHLPSYEKEGCPSELKWFSPTTEKSSLPSSNKT